MKLIITINGETRVLALPEEVWVKDKNGEKTVVALLVERDSKTHEIVDFNV